MKEKILLGKKFNFWTVVKFSHVSQNRKHYWFCKCECGTKKAVPIINVTNGHSKSCGCWNSIGKLCNKNVNWKGGHVKRDALHDWVRRRLHKPKLCVDCKRMPPYDLANVSQKYKRDLSDWEYLCRRCHMKKDGRLNFLHSAPMHAKRKKRSSELLSVSRDFNK